MSDEPSTAGVGVLDDVLVGYLCPIEECAQPIRNRQGVAAHLRTIHKGMQPQLAASDAPLLTYGACVALADRGSIYAQGVLRAFNGEPTAPPRVPRDQQRPVIVKGSRWARRMTLNGGGTMTLSIEADVLDLDADDRELLLWLIDRWWQHVELRGDKIVDSAV